MSKTHILVVDDDQRLRQLLERYLSSNGFLVSTANDAEQGKEKIAKYTFDLIILDVMLPGESGIELLSSLRNNKLHPASNVPILLLTAMGETDSRILGLENGADDYLSKPFEPKELLLRIHNILRRVSFQRTASKTLCLGSYSFDVEKAVLSKGHDQVALTTVESNLLKILALNPGKILSREELALRGGVGLSPRTVDVQVTRLRRKIEQDLKNPMYIKTVRHQGYVLWSD